jgi:hypothetical protein
LVAAPSFAHVSQQFAGSPFGAEPDFGRMVDQFGVLGLPRVMLLSEQLVAHI